MKTNVIKQGGGKSLSPASLRRKLLPVLIAGCFSTGQVLANPTGAQVVNGQVSITSQGNVLTVTNSPGAIINWQSFSIGQGELTQFVQQGASSTVLNRIIGQDPSQILGALQSNGRVFLINPNGILFGQGAQVNVGGLVASTLNISNEDFLAGRMKFQAGDKAANLQNQGSITAASGGQIYLVAPNVENSGILTSSKGEVVLAAGQSVHLVDSANPDLHVVVSAPENQAINLGQVVAESGKIGIYGALIKQRGLVSANSAVVGENGKIVFKASKDTLLEAGSVTTATGAGSGGTVHVLGERVGLTGNAKVDVSGQTGGGNVLVGGDYQGKNAAVVNAKHTLLGRDAEIKADAMQQGDGGKVILWSDELTRAYGSISAKGGEQGGNGGFVEVSGKQRLNFDATVSLGAPKGSAGKLLLDPLDIIIQGGNSAPGDSALDTGNSVDLPEGGSTTNITISEAKLESLSGSITLQASQDVIFQNMSDGVLDLNGVTGASTFTVTAGRDIKSLDPLTTDIIRTNGGGVSLAASAGLINIGGSIETNGGFITMNAAGALSVGAMSSTNGGSAGNITLTSGGTMALGRVGHVDALGSPPGDITLTSGGAITMAGGHVIRANRLKMTAAGGIDDGAGGVMSLDVGSLNAYNSGSGDIEAFNARSLLIEDIGSSGYGIKQELGGGNIFINAIGNLNVNAPVSTGNGTLTLTATGGLTNATTLTSSGTVTLAASGGNILNTGSITSTGDGVVLSGSTSVDHYGTVSSGGGFVMMSVSDAEGTLYLDQYSQILNAGGVTSLSADKMTLDGAIDTSGGHAMLTPTSSIAIHIGTDDFNSTSATLELSNTELSHVQADKLIIGTSGAGGSGAITIKSTIALPALLSLQSAGAITQEANALIATQAFEAIGSSVTLMEANPTGVISGSTSFGDFQYHSTNQITVSTGVSAVGIVVPNTQTIRLEADSFGINQTYGSALIGGQLAVKTPGTVFLDTPYNSINKVAADLYVGGAGTGSFSLLNSGSISIDGTYYGITGITTNNQNVEISVPSGGYTITESQPIVTGTGSKNLRFDGLLTGGMISTTTTTSTTSTSTSSTSSTSTTSTSSTTSSTSTTSASSTSTTSTSTTTTSTTSTTAPQSAAQDPALNNAVTRNSTNTIVAGTSTVVPDAGAESDKQKDQEKDMSRSSDAIVREEQSGVRKDEAAQKLYCN